MNLSRQLLACLAIAILYLISSTPSFGQAARPRPQIVQPINESRLATLSGNTHPLARAAFDRGSAPADLPMNRMLLVLKRTPDQEAALQTLLDSQQDKTSPNFHHWLTPSEFGQQFGSAPEDLQTIAAWLSARGFAVDRVAQGGTVIEFSGSAAKVSAAFHTAMHRFVVNGEAHWANASDPQVPAALLPVVAGIDSLHDFHKTPLHRVGGAFSRSKTTGQLQGLTSDFTFADSNYCSVECYFLGPYDFAAVYNVQALWNASPAIDGTGTTLAIVGESDINIQDVRNFRTLFGLPANDPQMVVDGPDPGIVSGDETESDLDVEWSGAVAKGATIKFVASASTNATSGVDLSALYIVDNDLAPVLSESYGACELKLGAAGNQFIENLWEQAAAEGISVIVSSGDEGSAACDRDTQSSPQPAFNGLKVSGVASTPYDVAVGGTDFLNFGTGFNFKAPSTYWSATNDAHHASAAGYIPESTWNSTCTNVAYVILYAESSPEATCNDSRFVSRITPEGGGGGASNCSTVVSGSCSTGYAKPSWQVAPGVPNDGARDLPDVSLLASPGFMDSAYIICESDAVPSQSACDLNSPYTDFLAIGGTSASAPSFAGMMALVNQFTGAAGQGNPNYVLYRLASQTAQTSANCNATSGSSASCIFNDVTFGTIATACYRGAPNCVVNNAGDQYGILSGYGAGAGYDLATGLGSVSAYNLVHNWTSLTGSTVATSTALTLNNGNAVSITHGDSVPVNITVTPQGAAGNPPTGTVALFADTPAVSGLGNFLLVASGSAASVTGNTTLLPGGTQTIHAHYAGDGIFAPSDSAPVSVTVAPENSVTALSTWGYLTTSLSSVFYGFYGVPMYMDIQVATARAGSGVGNSVPIGTVTVTDTVNGISTPFPGSPFPLNSAANLLSSGVFTLAPGTHSFTANYSGDASFRPSSFSVPSFLVYKSMTYLSLNTITSAIAAGSSFSDVATLNTMAGDNPLTKQLANIAFPTGTITFSVDSTVIGSPMPVFASANPNTHTAGGSAYFNFLANSSLAIGSHVLTAVYSGDANYLAATAVAVPFIVQADFALSTSPSPLPTVTISAPGGSSNPISLSIAGQAGYNSIVNFTPASCSIVPAGSLSTCSFTPSSLTGSGNVQLTIQTTAPQKSARFFRNSPLQPRLRAELASGILLLFGCVVLYPWAGRRRSSVAVATLILVVALVFTGCGGGGSSSTGGAITGAITNPGTPTNVTYTVVVTATGGAITHSANFNFVVQ